MNEAKDLICHPLLLPLPSSIVPTSNIKSYPGITSYSSFSLIEVSIQPGGSGELEYICVFLKVYNGRFKAIEK